MARVELPPSHLLGDKQVKQLMEMLNAHPNLTRRVYYRLTCPNPMSFAALLRDAASDDGPFGDHLRTLLVRIKQHSGQDLLAACGR
jgi:hypothetical protein